MRKLYFTVAVAIFTVVFGSKAVGESVDSYDPIRFGLPEAIGGYPVLAVLTEENTACMKPGEKHLVLQSLQPTIDDTLRGFPKERSELTQWKSSIVGPGLTREHLVSQLEQLYRSFKVHGCVSLDLPNTSTCSTTGECKNPPPYQAYAIIQNTSMNSYSAPVHAQSVILVAPIIGSSQGGILSDKAGEAANNLLGIKKYVDCTSPVPAIACTHHPGYSAFLNNGMTDKGYFLQVGFYFTNKATVAADGVVTPGDQHCQAPAGCFGDGLVVWAGALTTGVHNRDLRPRALFSADTNAQPTAVPYIPGHEYYTTITYTGGIWWTCAADLADTSTYQCQNHPNAQGDHLIEDMFGTNVFVENWNQNIDWARGFTIQWAAHDARVYVNGLPPQTWSSQSVWTINSCPDAWPKTNAVVGSLRPDGRQFNDGWAFFNADGYIPPFCF